MPKENELLLTS